MSAGLVTRSPSPASRRAARSAAVGPRGARRVPVTGSSLSPRVPVSPVPPPTSGQLGFPPSSLLLHLLYLPLCHSSDLGAPCPPCLPAKPVCPLPSFTVHFGLSLIPSIPLGPQAQGCDWGAGGSLRAGREGPGRESWDTCESQSRLQPPHRQGTPPCAWEPASRRSSWLLRGLLQDQVWVLH